MVSRPLGDAPARSVAERTVRSMETAMRILFAILFALTTGTALADSPSDADQGGGNDPQAHHGGSADGSGNGNPGRSGPGNS